MYFVLSVNWLDHSRTFREQGVDENETLLLRRKFFYSDQNVDSRDPVQLNLLYVQVRLQTREYTVPFIYPSSPNDNNQNCVVLQTNY